MGVRCNGSSDIIIWTLKKAQMKYGFVEFLNTGGDENGGSGSYFPNMTCNFFSHHSNSSSLYNYRGMGYCANNAPITGLTLLPTGGNIDLKEQLQFMGERNND